MGKYVGSSHVRFISVPCMSVNLAPQCVGIEHPNLYFTVSFWNSGITVWPKTIFLPIYLSPLTGYAKLILEIKMSVLSLLRTSTHQFHLVRYRLCYSYCTTSINSRFKSKNIQPGIHAEQSTKNLLPLPTNPALLLPPRNGKSPRTIRKTVRAR
jgi:hypothetical protein